jgi:hypothetical protein
VGVNVFPHIEGAVFLSAVLVAGDGVPNFNIEPVCHEVAQRAYAPDYKEKCLREEREAHEQLKRKWPAFTTSDRSYCVQLASLGGVPSYVALLTCLDVAQEARRVREAEARDRARRDVR